MNPRTKLYIAAQNERERIELLVREKENTLRRARMSAQEVLSQDPIGSWGDPNLKVQEVERAIADYEIELQRWREVTDFIATDGELVPEGFNYHECIRAIIINNLNDERQRAVKRIVDVQKSRAEVETLINLGQYIGDASAVLTTNELALSTSLRILNEWQEVKEYAEKQWDLKEIPFKPVPGIDLKAWSVKVACCIGEDHVERK